MHKNDINLLLNSFFLSQEELKKREIFNEFTNSLSAIIVDEFASNYLLNNPYLSIYLVHTDGSMLLKKIKQFVVFILTAPIDEVYIRKIHDIGTTHYGIKLEPAKVSYGFWAITEIVYKLSYTNELVKENITLITKLLKFVEHVMNDGYYIQKTKQENISDRNLLSIDIQNELQIGLNVHKTNTLRVIEAVKNKKFLNLETIYEDASHCKFGKVLTKLGKEKQYEYILGSSFHEINEIHAKWHVEFIALKQAIKDSVNTEIQLRTANISNYAQELSSMLAFALKGLLKEEESALSSGMKSIKRMTNLFYYKDYKSLEIQEPLGALKMTLKETILSEFAWVIKEIITSYKEIKVQDNSIVKQIKYKTKTIYLSIVLQEDQNNHYLYEMIHLLLEVLELQFSVQERELSLIQFADEAEKANKSKDMFLANMSHELRTPINAITGFSQILMMRKDTPQKVKDYVEKINISGNNLLNLVNTILDFAKLEAGKMQFNPSLSNISNIINEVNIMISPLANKKNISLTMPKIISLNLYLDATLFKQVLINILTNAIKFTAENGKVFVSITFSEEKHAYIFEIKDTGVGLLKEEISMLFQAFSQVDNIYQKQQQGTGLGLMIAKEIIENLHKGKIWVESEKGVGSSFFIEMPTHMVESHTYSVLKAPKDASHILVLEDSPEYQKILIENLQESYNMTLVDTVNKAKELLLKKKYDFLILDFFLIDGISSEVLYFMDKENIQTPSIVISAEDEIHILSSLSGYTNLTCIMNKKDIKEICAAIKK